MKRTTLRVSVMTPKSQHTLPIPPATVRLVLSSPSAFPIRVSFVSGEVALGTGGFIVSPDADTELIAQSSGPLYYASDFPNAILEVAAWHLGPEAVPISGGGAFDESFDDSFDIGF